MRYLIANRKKAATLGIPLTGKRAKDGRVILTEKELKAYTADKTAAERLTAVGAHELLEIRDIKAVVRSGGWEVING